MKERGRGEGCTMPGVMKEEGGEGEAHGGTEKLTRERALCAVSEPEASPYCVSPRVAFVSALVAPIVFCPHTRPFCFAASPLSRISLEPRRPRNREKRRVCQPIKGTGVYPRLVPTPLLPIPRSRIPFASPFFFVARHQIFILHPRRRISFLKIAKNIFLPSPLCFSIFLARLLFGD